MIYSRLSAILRPRARKSYSVALKVSVRKKVPMLPLEMSSHQGLVQKILEPLAASFALPKRTKSINVTR